MFEPEFESKSSSVWDERDNQLHCPDINLFIKNGGYGLVKIIMSLDTDKVMMSQTEFESKTSSVWD